MYVYAPRNFCRREEKLNTIKYSIVYKAQGTYWHKFRIAISALKTKNELFH